MKRCPLCAEMVDDQLSVCPYCGEPLANVASSSMSKSPTQPVTPPAESPAPKTTSPGTGNKRPCPVCGELIDAHLAVCPICFESTGFVAKPSVETPAPKPIVEEPPVTPAPTKEPDRKPVIEPERKTTPEPKTAPEPQKRPEREPVSRPEPKRQWPPQQEEYGSAPSSKGANPLKWLLIILCSLFVIGLGLLAYYLLRGDKEENMEPPVEVQKEAAVSSTTDQLSGAALIQHRLDSVSENISDAASALIAYLDTEHPCLYYVLDDKLMIYKAETDKTENVKIPIMSGSGKVLDAAMDEEDSEFLLIDMGDKNGNYAYTYRMNTITESFERLEDEKTDMPSQKPEEKYTRPDVKERPVPHRQRHHRGESDYDVPPPPPSNGNNSGFHLEPTNSGQGNNSGSRIRLEKVDHIPNQ